MIRTLSAPGKLFLSGEYAVLWGGVARIAAVGPRSGAMVRRREDRTVRLLLTDGALRGQLTPLGVLWEEPLPEAFRFVARTVDEALRIHGQEALGFDLALAPSPPGPGGTKLGLGGSARACVLSAEAVRFVLEQRYDALKLALVAHAGAQGGKGSGGDVAAAFAGGVVRYRRYPLEPLQEASAKGKLGAALATSPPVDLWRLPGPKLHLSYAFTNQSASTPSLIRQVERRLDEEGRARFVERSDELGNQLEQGLLRGEFDLVAAACRELQERLSALGALETEPMRQLLALAQTSGSAGKMSGAGGGDGCVIFSPDPQTRQATLEALGARGFHAFPVHLEEGLRGEAGADPLLATWLRA
jgi:phosphomevalonate kinase